MNTQEIQNYIEQLLTKGGFSFESIEFCVSPEGFSVFKIHSEKDSKDLLGRDGETLQALSTLVKRFSEKNNEMKQSFSIDINDFQEKKIQKIKIIAHMMAERSRFFKSSVELDPMNPFERHVIHEYIQNQDDLETESTGFGKDRRVVIKYKKHSPI